MVLLWKGKVENQNQSLYESQNRPEQLKEKDCYWFHNIYDSWKDYDSSKTIDDYSKRDWNWKIERLKDWKIIIQRIEIC